MVPVPAAAQPEPACAAAALALSFEGANGASDGPGHGGALMVVRNVGARPCRVPALPPIAFAGPDGAPLPVRFRPPPGMHPGPAVPPVEIAPGADVTAELRWAPGEASPGGRCYGTATVRVSFGAAVLGAPFARRFCGPAAGAPFGQSWLAPDARPKP